MKAKNISRGSQKCFLKPILKSVLKINVYEVQNYFARGSEAKKFPRRRRESVHSLFCFHRKNAVPHFGQSVAQKIFAAAHKIRAAFVGGVFLGVRRVCAFHIPFHSLIEKVGRFDLRFAQFAPKSDDVVNARS